MIKDFYHKIIGKSTSSSSGNADKPDTYGVEDCKTELKKVQDENDELKRQVRERENEIAKLKGNPK